MLVAAIRGGDEEADLSGVGEDAREDDLLGDRGRGREDNP
jgi:hypothetical protein